MNSGVRILWVLAAAVFLFAAYRLETHYERAIAASKTTIETLYRDTTKNQNIVAHAAVLRAAQTSAERELRDVSREHSLAAVTASLLLTLHQSARRCHVQVLAIQPGTTIAEDRLIATALSLRMHGSFADLITFLQDISRHADIISVSRTDLALSTQNGGEGDPKLDATIHATFYRLQRETAIGRTTVAAAQ